MLFAAKTPKLPAGHALEPTPKGIYAPFLGCENLSGSKTEGFSQPGK